MARLRVAVIGAGPAGLSMCKALANEQRVHCVVFEKSEKIGGVWVYTKDKRQNGHHDTTALYKNLRTNLPKEIMAFPEFPFPTTLPSYMRHELVLKYLEEYTDHFGLRKFIKFQNEVISVKPCENKGGLTWEVITKDLRNGETEQTGVFDAVVVCNGHHSDLRIPEITGMGDFPGVVMHSYYYSEPDEFTNKTVVVLGARSSGMDICIEISSVAKKVYLVHREKKLDVTFPENVEEILGTVTHGFDDGSVEINNECRKMVDCVIFCTGYNYAFPFLAPECKIEVNNHRVTSLYKHVFNTAYPSLSFVGLCTFLNPFPTLGLQSQWVASILTRSKVLPSTEEMVRDEERDYKDRLSTGVGAWYMHSLGIDRLKKYNDKIAELAGVPLLDPVLFSLYMRNSTFRHANLLCFRNVNYSITESGWSIVE